MIDFIVIVFGSLMTVMCFYFIINSIHKEDYILPALAASIISSGIFIAIFGESFPVSLFQVILILFIGLLLTKIFFFDRILKTANYFTLTLLLLVVMAGSLFYSKGIEGGLINLIRLLTLCLLVFLIIQIKVEVESLDLMINIVVIAAIIISCISILENILNPQIAIQNVLSSGLKIDRATAGGIYADPNRFAASLFLPIIYSFILVLTTDKIKTKIFFSFSIAVLIIGLVSSYSRSAFLSLGLTLLIITIYLKKVPQLSILSLIGLVIILSVQPLRSSFLLYGERILELLGGAIDTSSNIRLMLGSAAIGMFMDSNMIGVGFGAFSENFISYFSTQESVGVVEPHNVFYTIFAELGLIGFLIFILILVKIFADGVQVINNVDLKTKPLAITLLASFSCYIIFYQFYGGALYDAFIYLIIGIILMLKVNIKEFKGLDSTREISSPNSTF